MRIGYFEIMLATRRNEKHISRSKLSLSACHKILNLNATGNANLTAFLTASRAIGTTAGAITFTISGFAMFFAANLVV